MSGPATDTLAHHNRRAMPSVTCSRCQRDMPRDPAKGEQFWTIRTGQEFFEPPDAKPVCIGCMRWDERGWRRQITPTCPICAKPGEVVMRWRMRLYCSDACREEARRQRRRRQRSQHRLTCTVCGDEFSATRTDARTCSVRCRVRAHRATA